MFVLLKVIPLLSIWKTKINLNDVAFTMLLFILYLIWVKKGFLDFKNNLVDVVLYNKNTLPGMMFLDKII
jgi:uncharacterized membrane protein